MASSALPAILAYRRGDLIANLVHFVDEIAPGQPLSITSVETVLSKYFPTVTQSHNIGTKYSPTRTHKVTTQLNICSPFNYGTLYFWGKRWEDTEGP
jgi:hypothetical protein